MVLELAGEKPLNQCICNQRSVLPFVPTIIDNYVNAHNGERKLSHTSVPLIYPK